jgi:hypothetical protein
MDSPKFQQLKFRIFGKTDEEVLEILKPLEVKYAQIRLLKKTSESVYLATMRYLIFLYDPGTDLNREHVRLEDRRTAAASLSGLNKLTDLKTFDGIFYSSSADILEVIQVLLTEVYHQVDYREWQTLHRELDEYTTARWDKVDSGRKRRKKGDEVSESASQSKASMETLNLKSKLREDCKRIRELIEELDRKIFGDHTQIKNTAYKSRFLNPESFSRAAKQAI